MNFKRSFCLLIAVLLTASAVLLLFPNWLFAIKPDIDFTGTIVNLDDLKIEHFPFYGGRDGVFGVSDLVKGYTEYVSNGTENAPDILEQLKKLTQRDDFMSELYAFLFISLLTVPVYMLIRFVIYDTVYEIPEMTILPLRILLRGVFAASASLVTVFITWFLYRTVIFDIVLTFLMEKIQALTNMQFALNATNIFMLVVLTIAVIALLRATLFRGSIFTSILGAILRTALFIMLVAVIALFYAKMTMRAILFMLAAFAAIGILKSIFLPEKRAAYRARRH
ncbi:MAG: hypothetical protein IJC48_07870 [Clostridia bacterium]|nr:hypothetical protein [Clostridia bacterium]